MTEIGTLLEAIRAGDVEQVRALVSESPAFLEARVGGVSPLLLAVYHRQEAVAQALVDLGAPVDLFEACAIGDVDRAAAWLAGEPAAIQAFSPDGHSPLGLACFFGHDAVAVLLLDRGADIHAVSRNPLRVQPLHSAVAGGDPVIVQMLLERGADPNATQDAGFTPLHGAANAGDLELTRMLLGHGADPGACTDDGRSPAEVARERGHEELARLLASLTRPGSR